MTSTNLKPCPFCGYATILVRPLFPHGANRSRCVGYIVECQQCQARVEGEIFDDVPGSYEMFGDSPLGAAREYAIRKWNARGAEEFSTAINGSTAEPAQPADA